ncbi:MAG TPA: hypothetical protein VK815_15170 [Candidatus Acidoferrales bacterium]|jgi:tetratricopeptide (TPR) repeat protein|nr:hypothetical protein [Candidatus Acidoferrales bacterium]
MKGFLVAVMLAATFAVQAAAPPRGDDRLRELVVFPEMNLNFNFGMSPEGIQWVINENVNLTEKISQLREEAKQQPGDIKRILNLAYALDKNDETNESQACYQKAEQLCRKKLATSPQDGLTMIDLGAALQGLIKKEEAESVYRRATLVSSNEWRCWASLGNYLAEDYGSLFANEPRGQEIFQALMSSQEDSGYRPPAEALKQLEAKANEAARCYERAVALAPGEPELYLQRAGYACSSNMVDCLIRHYRDKEAIDSKTWLLAFWSQKTIADLQKAAELSPKNYQYISLATYYVWYSAILRLNGANSAILRLDGANTAADALPDTTRDYVHGAMARLEQLSEDPDKKIAAGALEHHGMLSIFLKNTSAAQTDLRRAVALDPARESSWDMLLVALAESGSPEEKVAVCEARLKARNSAWNHLLLARAFQYLKKWDKAGEEIEAALKLEPDNLVAQLELAALALTQSNDPDAMAKAGTHLAQFEKIFEKAPYSKESESEWRCLNLNLAIYDALTGAPGSKDMAKACLETVLKRHPDDQDAKAIAGALN